MRIASVAGWDRATITVSDGTNTSSATINWSVAPSPIQFTAVPDQTSNQGDSVSLQAHATDTVSGATLSFSSSGLPAGLSISSGGLISGTVSLAANNVSYSPIITVTDGTNQNSLGINWTVNSVITITQTPDQVSSEGSSVSLPIHATDSTSPAALSFSATGLPTGTSINSSTGVISGTVARGAANSGTPYTTTITVGDGTSSSSETFSWAINSAITITQTADQSSTEGQTISLPIQATDTTSPATLSFSATGLPTGTSINSSTGVISGTVADGAANSGTPYTSTITVGDGTSSITETFSWAVASAITITQTLDQVSSEGDSVSVAVVAADATSGATVSYAAAGLPVGLAIDASTGVISGTVAGGASAWGPYAPTITVTDSNSTSTETLNWTVNPSITITQTPDQYSSEGQTVSLPIQASDSSGYTTSYFASSLPAGLSINSSTGLISGTTALGAANSGVPYSTTITVSDGIDATSIAFNWTVTSAITITAIPDQSNNEGDSVSLHVHASDATSGSTVSYTAVGLPAGLSINSSSGLISGTIALGAANSGPFTATITVSDGTSAATTNINWSVNSAITITAIPDQTNNEGDSVSLHVHASDATSGSTVAFFAAGLPQGLSMNASTGVISGAIALGAGNLGSFTVTLTVTDGTSAATTSINWTVNSAITITAIPDQSNNEGDSVSLHVHASDATSGSTLSYFAAGLPQGLSMNASTGVISGTIALGAANAGPFTAIITVSDGTSATTTSINWTVNSAITITAIPDQTNKEGDSVSLHVHASDATSGSTVSYFAAGLPQGLSINSSSGLISGTIALGAGNLGSFTATITVTDGTSAATTSINWTVNSAITITAIPDQTNNEGDSVSLHVHASDATSGSTVSYFAAGLPQGLSMNASTGVISGTIALGAANSGPFTATITVSDGTSATLTSISWTVNSAITITAIPDQTNNEGDSVSLHVHATDSTSGSTVSYFAAGLPQSLSINASTGVISGTISLGAGNLGTYTATITVSDGTSATLTSINWTVNSAITITAIPDQTNNEGDSVSLQVHASDATSGSTLAFFAAGLPQGLSMNASSGVISGTIALGAGNLATYSATITVSDGTSATLTSISWTVNSAITITAIPDQTNNEGDSVSLYVHVSDATSGSTLAFFAAGLPQGLSIDSSTGAISGTIALGAANLGTFTATITVSDGTSATTTSISWTVNSAITITAIPDQTNKEGDSVSLHVHAADATSGSTLAFFAAGLPQGLSIDSSTGAISGTIALGAANSGPFTATITVSDGTSATLTSINWTVNSAITITAIPDQTNNEEDSVSLQVNASDATSGSTLAFFAAGLPQGLSINSSSGLISGTISLGAGNIGTYTATITVSDGTSATLTSINWTVNSAITITAIPDQTNNEGDSVSLQVNASDTTSGSTLAFFAAGLPQGLSMNASTGVISGTIALGAANSGPFTATITVSDGTSATTTSINWTVNSAITITAIPDQTNNEGDSVSLQVNASDTTSGSTLAFFAAGLPQGLSMNSSSGLISGTIALGAANSGPFTATITVSDGTSATTTSINWTVNSAITITQPTNQVNDEGDTVSLQINATDATSGATTSFFAAGLPQGLAIDPSSGLITGTIALGAANTGSASPTITVTDGTSSATVSFTWFVRSAITVFAFPDEKTAEGATVSVGVNASDATSGAILVYAIAGLPEGLAIDPATGVISGTVALGAANLGSYSPVVTVSDGVSAVTKDLNWTVTSAITITPIANQTSNEGATVSLTVSATDATSGATMTFAAAGLPQGLSINPSSGAISGTIALGAANLGPYSVTIQVSDGTSSSSLNVGWTVNSAISITAVAAQTNNEGDTVSLSISATDATPGMTLHYSVAGLPNGLSINPSTGVISGTIAWGAANQTSTFTPVVTVSDGTSANVVSIAWTVNSAISITALANQVNTAGDTVSLSVSASDLHTGATMSFASSNLPPGLSMNASTGVISGTIGSGVSYGSSYSVTVTVGDGTSSAMTSLTWTIGPLAVADSYSTQENTTLTVAASVGILANDFAASGTTLTPSVVTQPAHGSLTLSSDGSFTYVPSSNWFGTDTFIYVDSDGSVTSAPATVTIQVIQVVSTTDYRAVATGDFNGDGNADIVAANYSSNAVDVYLGNGDGIFPTTPTTTISVGNGPIALAVGDFGNGADDIAVANSGSDSVSILTNDGTGAFTATTLTLSTGAEPVALALGDFLGNGNLDLAVVNKGLNSVSIFLNNGSGTFSLDTTITVGIAPDGLAAGDLNNDGFDDLVVANSGSNNISVLLSNGDGSFASPVNYSVGAGPTAVVLAAFDDFNGDTNLDVAVANGGDGTVSILMGNGDGTLSTATTYTVGSDPVALAVGDLNDSGVPDLIVANHGSNNLSVLVNDCSGDFSVFQTISLDESPDSLAVDYFANNDILYYEVDAGLLGAALPDNKLVRKVEQAAKFENIESDSVDGMKLGTLIVNKVQFTRDDKVVREGIAAVWQPGDKLATIIAKINEAAKLQGDKAIDHFNWYQVVLYSKEDGSPDELGVSDSVGARAYDTLYVDPPAGGLLDSKKQPLAKFKEKNVWFDNLPWMYNEGKPEKLPDTSIVDPDYGIAAHTKADSLNMDDGPTSDVAMKRTFITWVVGVNKEGKNPTFLFSVGWTVTWRKAGDGFFVKFTYPTEYGDRPPLPPAYKNIARIDSFTT